jgi:hypothetical protein
VVTHGITPIFLNAGDPLKEVFTQRSLAPKSIKGRVAINDKSVVCEFFSFKEKKKLQESHDYKTLEGMLGNMRIGIV